GTGQDLLYLLLELARGLLAEVLTARDLAAQEDWPLVGAPGDVLGVAHAHVEDHLLGEVRRLLEVVACAGGDGAGDLLLGYATRERHDELRAVTGDVVEHVLLGERRHEAAGPATGHDRDLA